MNSAALAPTLATVLWPAGEDRVERFLRAVLLAVVGSALLAVSAQIQVPMYPVPMTMQSFVVLVIGAAYGARLGGATVLLYLLEGAVGLPVFAGMKSGLVSLTGTTGGYLFGFFLAATLVGWLAERGWDRSLRRTVAMMVLGKLCIFVPGLTWLALLIGVDKAIMGGLVPFLPGIVLKSALAIMALPGAWRLIGRREG